MRVGNKTGWRHWSTLPRGRTGAALLAGFWLACAALLAPAMAHAQAAPKAAPKPAAKSVSPTLLRHVFVSGSAGGVVELRVPADWVQSGRSTPIDLTFTRPGSRENLRITALPVPKDRMALMTEAKMQEILRERGTALLPVSVEKTVELTPLMGAASTGHYFALTDKRRVDAPDSDTDFRFMHSGMIKMGGWMVVFSVFTNNRDGVFAREALGAVASLRWREPDNKRPDLFAGMRLGASPAPELKQKSELVCTSDQAGLFFEKFDAAYAGLLRTRVSKTAYESFDDGKGDAGAVMYMEFAVPLAPETTSFVAGLLWGAEFPDRLHPEEFYLSGSQMVIWCTKADSRIKRLSQARLEALLFGAK